MVNDNFLNGIRILILGSILVLPNVSVDAAQPYAGQQKRAIKALSQKDINDLKSGAGMGYAKAAELNHYPGPAHVLENFDSLGFSGEQRQNTRRLYERMKVQAVKIGRKIIEKESHLDHLFASGKIDKALLEKATEQISRLNGRLRYIHLQTHIDMKQLMTKHQVAQYDLLRGYGEMSTQNGGHKGHH